MAPAVVRQRGSEDAGSYVWRERAEVIARFSVDRTRFPVGFLFSPTIFAHHV